MAFQGDDAFMFGQGQEVVERTQQLEVFVLARCLGLEGAGEAFHCEFDDFYRRRDKKGADRCAENNHEFSRLPQNAEVSVGHDVAARNTAYDNQ